MKFYGHDNNVGAETMVAAMADVFARAYSAHAADGGSPSMARNFAGDAMKAFVKTVEEVEFRSRA